MASIRKGIARLLGMKNEFSQPEGPYRIQTPSLDKIRYRDFNDLCQQIRNKNFVTQDFTFAITQSVNTDMPSNEYLMAIYYNIYNNSLVRTEIEKNLAYLFSNEFIFTIGGEEIKDQNYLELLDRNWIKETITLIYYSMLFGFSMFKYQRLENNDINCLPFRREEILPYLRKITPRLETGQIDNSTVLDFDALKDKRDIFFVTNNPTTDRYYHGLFSVIAGDFMLLRNSTLNLYKIVENSAYPLIHARAGNKISQENITEALKNRRDRTFLVTAYEDTDAKVLNTNRTDPKSVSLMLDLASSNIVGILSGADIGKDTERGARSKEEQLNKEFLRQISAKAYFITRNFNNIVLPWIKDEYSWIDSNAKLEFRMSDTAEKTADGDL